LLLQHHTSDNDRSFEDTCSRFLFCVLRFLFCVLFSDAGEKGGQVSGGQKQRIAIARALIRRPEILVLDNATSDLDAETEKKVHDAVLNLSNHCTVLLISNKLEMVKSADHIVYLHQGAVPEQGRHDQLMGLQGHYAELVEKQNKGFQRQTEQS
ncbi:uncharacterized protein LOC129411827, partial [Boleophthalmus pectinirostris]|uniref:uncharacterized protein LOC129411827 n=1 Tax=Boleophthalmus pectinirostris TaxID=150288 RepID=UPI00242AAA04